ncbi:MAG: ATPase P [Lachnospiraceae bacterium]|nr:ATPase P [Lachnospiraceae bacterium]
MVFAPQPICNIKLPPDELRDDKKHCIRIGPCGLGEKAVYLNSFFIDRRYYVTYQDIRRVFKRVAMSKGGFSGKGAFGSIPYLVVLLANGTEQQCNFKYEEQVDEFLNRMRRIHPEIPTMSEEAEKRLAEERAREEARYVKNLSPAASTAVGDLKRAKSWLEDQPEISEELSAAAKKKRGIDRMNPYYRYAAVAIFLLALGSLIFGIISLLRHDGIAIYFVLFGMAFIFYTMSSQVLPTGRNNKRYAEERWQKAVKASAEYTAKYESFPVPPQYAHPATFDRMIRVIREGRAEDISSAWETMKADLKAINSEVTVSQTEYDEIVAIKPMFLLCDYEDKLD